MRSVWWLALALAVGGCKESGVLSGDDTDGLVGAGDDTDRGDDSGDTGDGGGPGPGGQAAWHHVISYMEILPSEEGLDLDGDGDVDNALGFLSEWIPTDGVGDFLADADTLLILQTWGVEDADQKVGIGALSGTDSDEDPSDNFDGETFVVAAGVRPTGRALVSVETTLGQDGSYEAELPAAPLDLGVITIPIGAPWNVVAKTTAGGQEGFFGTAIAIKDIQALLRQNNLGFLANGVAQFADVDLDGDGTDDALSLAVGFEAVPCQIELLPR